MPDVPCKICKKSFYAKPNWLKKGWGKYCSRKCRNTSQLRGKYVKCFLCAKEIWRGPKDLQKSKSKNFFCGKRCQTIWRNSIYVREKHSNWNTGKSSYRQSLLRSGKSMNCRKCGLKDTRVLAVHHKDRNRENNTLSNLEWLCHNCHYLVHHYSGL
jgi:hypothetical protein